MTVFCDLLARKEPGDGIDELRDKFHRPLPGADLLMSDVYAQLMPLVRDVKDLGSASFGIWNVIILLFAPRTSTGRYGSLKATDPIPAGT